MNKAEVIWQAEYSKLAKQFENEEINYNEFITKREELRTRLGFETTVVTSCSTKEAERQ